MPPTIFQDSYSPSPRNLFWISFLWHRCTLGLVGLVSPFSYTVGEWTLNASLTTSSSYRKCSKRRTLDHSAQATSLLQIEDTTRCVRLPRQQCRFRQDGDVRRYDGGTLRRIRACHSEGSVLSHADPGTAAQRRRRHRQCRQQFRH